MIVKKPYAFLIKNFRLIHGLLFATLAFILYKSFEIYNFFSDYVSLHYYESNTNLTSTYVNFLVFFIIILSSLINLLIYFILNMKKKDSKVYLNNFLLEIIVFIYYIFMFTVFKGLETKSLDAETVMAYRDIAFIILIPELIFTIIMLSRTFGFNLKQFDFKKDLESIEIVQSDNEEIELSFGNNTYKVKRFFRKLLRLTKYFIVENKIFVIGVSSILALVLSLSIFLTINVYNKEYEEKQSILANSILYNINKSYITSYDMNNEIVNDNKKYIIVDININNSHSIDYELTRETFTLTLEDEIIHPNFGYKKEFRDLGVLYEPMTIEANTNNSYIIVFEIDKELVQDSYILKIKNFENNTIVDIDSKYKNIRINPKDIDDLKNETTYNLVADVDLSESIIKDTKIKISEYELSALFKDKASILQNNSYKDIYYTITPNNINSGSDKLVLKLKTTMETTNEDISKFILYPSDLIDAYGKIRYNLESDKTKYYTFNVKTIDSDYNKDTYTYIEVPYNIKKAENIELLLVIRGIKYTIILK